MELLTVRTADPPWDASQMRPGHLYFADGLTSTRTYAQASLLCPCGCGFAISVSEDPQEPERRRWTLALHEDGTVSAQPSIQIARCGTHFWIARSRVEHC